MGQKEPVKIGFHDEEKWGVLKTVVFYTAYALVISSQQHPPPPLQGKNE